MKFFETSRDEQYTIIIGCGRLGSALANELSNQGGNVLIIDSNQDSFRRLSPDFGGLTITGDGTDLDTLTEAQITSAAVVIAVTNDDNINIMAAQLAKNLFHTAKVIARLYDPEKRQICESCGICPVCPALLSAREIAKQLDARKTA